MGYAVSHCLLHMAFLCCRRRCCFFVVAYILERRVFHRIQDDILGPVARTWVLYFANMFHAVVQRHFFAMLLMVFDRSPYSMDDKWFVYILVLDFDYIVMDNLYVCDALRIVNFKLIDAFNRILQISR